MFFPQNNKVIIRKCFVCGEDFSDYEEFKKHIVKNHEEGREYLICPLKHCKAVCRDLRAHFKFQHKCTPPKNCQLRPTILYSFSEDGKRKKALNFKTGYFVSPKNGGKSLVYRSSWELTVYDLLERLPEVLFYKVEEVVIEYFMGGKMHRYYPELLIGYIDGSVTLAEIKPKNQVNSDMNKRKFAAAENYCLNRGFRFEVLTESKIEELKKEVHKYK